MKAPHANVDLLFPESRKGTQLSNYQLAVDRNGNFTTADLTLVMLTCRTMISLCKSIMCMYKSDCVVITDATFVVAMQKRPMCYISTAII